MRLTENTPLFCMRLIVSVLMGLFVCSVFGSTLPTVELMRAQVRNATHIVYAQGTVASPMMTTVSSSVAGHVVSIEVGNGQKVQKGESLIILDHQAVSDAFNQAKIQAGISLKALNRAQYLVDRHLLSQESFDLAKSQYSKDEATFEGVKNELANYTIRAPFSGVVGKAMLSVGDYVTAGQPLVPLVSLDQMTVDYSLSENELAKVKVGDAIGFSTPIYPDKTFQAVVSFIALSIDPKTRTFDVQASISKKDLHHFRPGMFVRVSGVENHVSAQILIPEQAVVISQGKPTVFILENGRAIEKSVTLGERRLGEVVVLTGIQAHDQVIVSGQDDLHNNQKVSVHEVSQ